MNKRISLRKRLGLELFHQQELLVRQKHELRTLFWECTLRCNVACRHCGSDCRVACHQPDMPQADFLQALDKITPQVDPHRVFIIFTGGEPLMRKDLEQCGLACYQRGYPWGIVTNGLLLSRSRLDALLQSGMHSITVSLDGLEETHNWLRRHPQSFRRASEAVRMLSQEKELVWDVVSCIHQRNLKELPAFRDYLIQSGVQRWRLFTIFPVGRAKQTPELQLTPAQFAELLDFIRQTRTDGQLHTNFACEGFLGPYETEVRDYFFRCHAGISVGSIRINGAISGCPSIRSNYDQGNIYQDDFMEVWNHRFEVFRHREWARQGICADCSMFRYCEGNGMHLHDENGRLMTCHYHRLQSNIDP